MAQSDIRNQYLFYLQQTNFPTAIMTNAQIERWIDTACDYMDSKLAERYEVPVTNSPTPPILRDIASLLTAYYVLRAVYTGQDPNSTKWVDAFRDEANDKLSQLVGYDVKTGTVKERQKVMPLLASGGNAIEHISQTGAKSSTASYRPTFGVSDVEDADVDQDRVNEETKRNG